ncbi:MAG: TIGR02646 family protein [Dokdonella sp.]|nr:TIGR02646 family protein [Dokdonella sp.]
MVELQHRHPEPPELVQFRLLHPAASPTDWDHLDFVEAKRSVKSGLHQDQAGLCVYCEMKLPAVGGHVEHIKPKSGPNAHAQLCFVYVNLAHSCDNPKTCGHKKKAGLLPIEPGPGCNADWSLTTDGTIEPTQGLSRQRRHAVTQTRDMLGLNKDSDLVDERKRWLKGAIDIAQQRPADLPQFLAQGPFRHIMATVF